MVLYVKTEKEIKQILKHYGLILDSYRPDRTRLYQVIETERPGNPLSLRLTIKELRAWTEGYVVGKGEW